LAVTEGVPGAFRHPATTRHTPRKIQQKIVILSPFITSISEDWEKKLSNFTIHGS
jgi:hypothetical protein